MQNLTLDSLACDLTVFSSAEDLLNGKDDSVGSFFLQQMSLLNNKFLQTIQVQQERN